MSKYQSIWGPRDVPWASEPNGPLEPLKYHVSINARTLSEGTDPDYEFRYIDIGSVDGRGSVTEGEPLRFGSAPSRARRVIRSGDTIVSTVRTYLRAIAQIPEVNGNVVCSTGFAALTPGPTLEPRFLGYWMRSDYVVDEIMARSTGVSYPAIAPTELGSIPVPVISYERQAAIADFLDRKTAAIDAAVTDKKRLVAVIEERRQAMIMRAVMKGLDPEAAMRDSGVEWMGRIPAHWETVRLRRVACRIETGGTPSPSVPGYYHNGSVPWYGPSSFGAALELGTPVKYLSAAAIRDGRAPMFAAGATLLVGIGATIGKVGLLTSAGSANQQITAIEPRPQVMSSRYLAYYMKNMEPIIRGQAPATTLPIINQQQVGSLRILLPPMGEQEEIADTCDELSKRARRVVEAARSSVQKLREYRSHLISRAVSGRLSVDLQSATLQ